MTITAFNGTAIDSICSYKNLRSGLMGSFKNPDKELNKIGKK